MPGGAHDSADDVSVGATTLQSLAKRACIRNIRAIVDVGDASYEQVRPILLKIPNPEQLHQVESNSPQLIGHTAELWRHFIKRDVEEFSSKDPPEPKNPASWYKLYKKLRTKEAAEIRAQEEMLASQLRGIEETAAKHTSKMVDPKSMPRLPRAPGMRVEKRPGAGSSSSAKTGDPSLLRFGSGSRTKMVTGQDVLNKAKREAREMSLFSWKNSALARPTHQLGNRASQVRAAPKGMVNDHARSRLPPKDGELPVGAISVPKRGGGKAPVRGNAAQRESWQPGPSKRKAGSDEEVEIDVDDSEEDEEMQDRARKMNKVPRMSANRADRSTSNPLVSAKPRPQPTLFMDRKRKPVLK